MRSPVPLEDRLVARLTRTPGVLLALFIAVTVAVVTNEHEAHAAASGALDLVGSLVGTSADVLETKIAGPIDSVVPTRLTTTTASSGTWAEFPATDIAVNARKPDVLQLLTVVDFDTAAKICIDFVNRDTNNDGVNDITDCGANPGCAGLATTCSGAATDADIVLPGVPRTFNVGGNMCICFLSSAANGDVQLAELVR